MSLLLVLSTACSTVHNAPAASPSAPPGRTIASFLSTSMRTSTNLGSGREATTTLTLRMTSGRVAFAVMQDAIDHGVAVHPMQALLLPDDFTDLAARDDVVCGLGGDRVRCASVHGDKRRDELVVPSDSKRLFLPTADERCVLRETGEWTCFTRTFDHPFTQSDDAARELARFGLAQEPVPDSRCFITRASKLVCFDQSGASAREQLDGVVSASVSLGDDDFGGGCAVMKDATVSCWTRGSGPQTVTGVHDAIAVSREPDHACALTKSLDVYCWGPAPRLVPELHGVTSIATGHDRTCGVRTDGRLLCLGGGYPGAWTAEL